MASTKILQAWCTVLLAVFLAGTAAASHQGGGGSSSSSSLDAVVARRALLSYSGKRTEYTQQLLNLAIGKAAAVKEAFGGGATKGSPLASLSSPGPKPSRKALPPSPPQAHRHLPAPALSGPPPAPSLQPPPPPRTSVPQPVGGLPRFQQIFQCPDGSNVKRFGAAGDMKADDAGAIVRACKDLPFLYFPPGGYRIASSITVNRPIVVGMGAYFWVEAGKTLIITAQPHHWSSRAAMFAGPGRVRLAGRDVEVYPDWFKTWGDEDDAALQKAADSCSTQCTLMLTRSYYLSKPWRVQPKMGTFATTAGILWPGGNNVTGLNPGGIVVGPGTYTRPLIFSGIRSFPGFGIKFQGGASKVEVQAGHISYCGDGVVFALGEGSPGIIRNVAVSHVSVMQANQNSIVFSATNPSHTLENVAVRGNFNLMGGFENTTAQAASVLFRGAPPKLINTAVVWQAVDPAQFERLTRFTMLQSLASGPVSNFHFGCETWAGGFEVPGRLIDGKFNKLAAMIFMAGPTVPTHMYQLEGEYNYVSVGTIGGPDMVYQLPAAKLDAVIEWGEPLMGTVFYVRAPVEGIWPPGQIRTFYFDSMLAATAGARMKCLPFRANNMGIRCAGFARQPAANRFRVALKLVNSASYAVPHWQQDSVYVGIQVGP